MPILILWLQLLNKGLWRLDYAALAPLLGEAEPVELQPEKLFYQNQHNPQKLDDILDSEKYLISMPGDEFDLYFALPEDQTESDYFLYSKGYYLEWMRSNWLQDKNLIKLKRLKEDPEKFLRKEARKYSKYESKMEQIFWNSRIKTENFSYYE